MPDFTEEELRQIIAAGETDRVEFKESLASDAATRLWEAICAFANDLAGREKPGLIFIGVKDDGAIGTLAVPDRLLQQLAAMKTDGNIVPLSSTTGAWCRWRRKRASPFFTSPRPTEPLAAMRPRQTTHADINKKKSAAFVLLCMSTCLEMTLADSADCLPKAGTMPVLISVDSRLPVGRYTQRVCPRYHLRHQQSESIGSQGFAIQ